MTSLKETLPNFIKALKDRGASTVEPLSPVTRLMLERSAELLQHFLDAAVAKSALEAENIVLSYHEFVPNSGTYNKDYCEACGRHQRWHVPAPLRQLLSEPDATMVLVPREPTKEMLHAGTWAPGGDERVHYIEKIWRAMLAAVKED